MNAAGKNNTEIKKDPINTRKRKKLLTESSKKEPDCQTNAPNKVRSKKFSSEVAKHELKKDDALKLKTIQSKTQGNLGRATQKIGSNSYSAPTGILRNNFDAEKLEQHSLSNDSVLSQILSFQDKQLIVTRQVMDTMKEMREGLQALKKFQATKIEEDAKKKQEIMREKYYAEKKKIDHYESNNFNLKEDINEMLETEAHYTEKIKKIRARHTDSCDLMCDCRSRQRRC